MSRIAIRAAGLCMVTFVPRVAMAEDLRDFCADRPGLGTPACTIDRSHVAAELGLLDWTLDRQPGSRTDGFLIGDFLFRYGVTEALEAQIGWSAFGHVSAQSGGLTEESSGTGDMLLAIRRNLRNPDGSGVAVAIMPFVTLPTGGSAIGVGDWGAGVLLPISGELPAGFQLGFTGIFEAAVDADRDGRHLAYGAIIGLDVPIGERLGATFELSARRDDDPSGVATELLGGLSAAWSPSASLQLDVGGNVGLNRDSPDIQFYFGIARRF